MSRQKRQTTPFGKAVIKALADRDMTRTPV